MIALKNLMKSYYFNLQLKFQVLKVRKVKFFSLITFRATASELINVRFWNHQHFAQERFAHTMSFDEKLKLHLTYELSYMKSGTFISGQPVELVVFLGSQIRTVLASVGINLLIFGHVYFLGYVYNLSDMIYGPVTRAIKSSC